MQTLHLGNWSGLRGRRVYCGMLIPVAAWQEGEGQVWAACPPGPALRWIYTCIKTWQAIAGQKPHLEERFRTAEATYRLAVRELFRRRLAAGEYTPGRLAAVLPEGEGEHLVEDGAGIACVCAAPGSPVRQHFCHLEELAPFLAVEWGQVWLHGQPYQERPAVWVAAPGAEPPTPGQRVFHAGPGADRQGGWCPPLALLDADGVRLQRWSLAQYRERTGAMYQDRLRSGRLVPGELQVFSSGEGWSALREGDRLETADDWHAQDLIDLLLQVGWSPRRIYPPGGRPLAPSPAPSPQPSSGQAALFGGAP